MNAEQAADEAMYDDAEIRTNLVCAYTLLLTVGEACDATTWRRVDLLNSREALRHGPASDAIRDAVADAGPPR